MTENEKYKNLLNAIKGDMDKAHDHYKPSHFWQHGCREIYEDFLQQGIDNFKSHQSVLRYFVPTYQFNSTALDPERYKSLRSTFISALNNDNKAILAADSFLSGKSQAYADFRVYLASNRDTSPYIENFSESTVGKPVEQFTFNEKNFSRSSLNYLLGINFLKSQLENPEIKTVIEIGGGFGSLGEILLSDKRNDIFYINIDIPPTIIFSTYYLKKNFGNEKIIDYEEFNNEKSHNLQALSRNTRGAVIAPWQIEQLEGNADLLVNFISFQEMEPDIVKNYLNHIDRLNTKYVLLRNLKEGKQAASGEHAVGVIEPILASHYDDFLPNYQLVNINVLPFGLATEDGFNSELRLYKSKMV